MQYFDTTLYVYMPVIFFIYGMSFFMLGLAVSVELFSGSSADTSAGRFRNFIATPLGCLALFGVLHGVFEFLSLYSIFYAGLPLFLKILKPFLLSCSFFYLAKFGTTYGKAGAGLNEKGGPSETSSGKKPYHIYIADILCGGWIVLVLGLLIGEGFSDKLLTVSEIFSRYIIGAPAAALASMALWSNTRELPPGARMFAKMASIGFGFYAAGVLVVAKADFFPASFLNYETFYSVTHFPTQLFRSVCALVITFSVLRLFRFSKDLSGIRFKAVTHVMLAVVVPTFCIILLVCYIVGDAFLRLSYAEHEKLAVVTAGEVLSMLDDADENVKYYVMFSRLAPAVAKRDIFLSLVRENAAVMGMAFFDERGELLRISKDPLSLTVSYKKEADDLRIKHFLEGVTLDMPANNFYLSGHDRDNIFVTVPLQKGHIEYLISLDRVYRTGAGLELEKGWHILLLDGKGEAVFPRGGQELGNTETREHLAPSSGLYGWKTIERGIYYNAIKHWIPYTSWSVIIEVPRTEIVAPVFGVYKALFAGFFFINLFSVIVAVVFVGKVTRPIKFIAERVKEIGREDYRDRPVLRTGDELETLSGEVEKMAVLLAEKKKMEKQIIQTEKLASLGRLVAGVAHEINNPLGIILGYSQMLQSEVNSDSRQYEDLKTVEKHTLKCRKIVEDLLRFSRANRQTNVEVDINANIRETLSLVTTHFSHENVSVIFNQSHEPAKVFGDPDRLHQLFLNLTLNALDAMKEGGKLVVDVRHIEAEGEKALEITFRDTGPGISPEDMERIFDPFFTTKEVGKGTGLGLSVSYGIVKDHNGKIRAESEVGKGTVFYVIIPAKEAGKLASRQAGEREGDKPA